MQTCKHTTHSTIDCSGARTKPSPRDAASMACNKHFSWIYLESNTKKVNEGNLEVTVCPWGQSKHIFDNVRSTSPLPVWQLQIHHRHDGHQNMKNRFLATAQAALQNTPYDGISDLMTLEREKGIRLQDNMPRASGVDPDGVGVQAWLATIYCAGHSPEAGLDFLKFLTNFKKDMGELREMPACILTQQEEAWPYDEMPKGWTYKQIPHHHIKPFSSKPPHGRRHLLMHLQKEPQASGATYVLTLRGDVYSHRKNLKEMGMKSQFMQLDNGRNDFVQSMRITNTEPDKEMIRHLLQQAVSETPIYLMDQTNTTDDTLVQWLQDQPTIYLKGSPKETRTGSNAQRPINEPPASQSQSEPPPY